MLRISKVEGDYNQNTLYEGIKINVKLKKNSAVVGNLSGSRTIRNLNRLALEWGVKEAWLEMTTLGFEDWTLGNVAT